VVALAIVLVALLPLIGTGSSFSGDEGAAIIEARHLARGEGWIVDHPLPGVGSSERTYPLVFSSRGANGSAPFAKHPLYALLLAAADRAGGTAAMVLLSMAGTLIAAALAATLAGHLRPTLVVPSLWVTGLATPLFFDGYLVIAHTLGAACAPGALVLSLRLLEKRGRPGVAIVGVATCLVVGTLLRAETVFWGIALGVIVGAVAISRRSAPVLLAAVTSVLSPVIARVGERAWVTQIIGHPIAAVGGGSKAGVGFVTGRLQALELTWLAPGDLSALAPGYWWSPRAGLALLVMVSAVIIGAVTVLRMPGHRPVIVMLSVTAAAAAVAAFMIAPVNVVPGLLVASPVVGAGIFSLRRSGLVTLGSRLAIGTFTLFASAVVVTQYASGGSVEWGGRYFALGLPVLIPVLLLGLADAGGRLDGTTKHITFGALAICSLMTAAMGLTTLRAMHRLTGRLTTSADSVGRAITPVGKPVMLATEASAPRLAWVSFERQRWLLVAPDHLNATLGGLREAGISVVVLVTKSPTRDEAAIGLRADVQPVAGPAVGNGWQVVVLHLRP